MAGLKRLAFVAAVALSFLEGLENLQNDLSGAIVRGHLSDDDRSQLLDINGALALNLGRQRNKKPVDEKELKVAFREISKMIRKQDFARDDAAKLETDLDDLKHRMGRR